MLSLQLTLEDEERKKAGSDTGSSICRKRKWSDGRDKEEDWLPRLEKAEEQKPDLELHLKNPLPLEWQRCLDIKIPCCVQSGRIHFYNTRTHKRTSKEPRLQSPESQAIGGLDLELNLAWQPPRAPLDDMMMKTADQEQEGADGGRRRSTTNDDATVVSGRTSPAWMTIDADRQEMVATVCMRCHMLVMMCKATLSCPNCKFLHPPRRSSPTSSPNLLCCKDY